VHHQAAIRALGERCTESPHTSRSYYPAPRVAYLKLGLQHATRLLARYHGCASKRYAINPSPSPEPSFLGKMSFSRSMKRHFQSRWKPSLRLHPRRSFWIFLWKRGVMGFTPYWIRRSIEAGDPRDGTASSQCGLLEEEPSIGKLEEYSALPQTY